MRHPGKPLEGKAGLRSDRGAAALTLFKPLREPETQIKSHRISQSSRGLLGGSRAVLVTGSGLLKSRSAVPPITVMAVMDQRTYAECRFCCKSRARMAVGASAKSMPALLLPLAPLGAAALTL